MEERELNQQQRQAVEHGQGPLLVVAGAGTGKTEVITRRIAYLINSGLANPDQILALTFTDKAAAEMQDRVDRLLPLGVVDVNVMTFNSFGDRLLRQYGLDIGLGLGLKLMSKKQQIVFLQQHFDELELEYYAQLGNPSSLFLAWLNYFSSLRNELITPEEYIAYANQQVLLSTTPADKLEATKHLELSKVYQNYTNLKRREGVMDYDDQISLSIELLRRRPNVLKAVQNSYKFYLVDEFQDTNLAQNQLIELLTAPTGNITAVGDDDQSIYKFRGAAVSNILAFNERYSNVEQAVLTQNYRSGQPILDAAYKLIQNNNPERLENKYGIDKRLVSEQPGTEPIVLTAASLAKEAEKVAEAIAQQIETGAAPEGIAVLVRKRKQFEPLVAALRRLRVPFSLQESLKFYQAPEIAFLLNFLRYMADPNQSDSLYHLLEASLFEIDLYWLSRLSGQSRSANVPLDSQLRELTEPPPGVAEFLRQSDKWRQYSANHSVGELAYHFLKDSGYLQVLEERAEDDPSVVSQFANLEKFFEELQDYQQVAADHSVNGYISSLAGFKDLDAEVVAGPLDWINPEVRLMTIHQAKGLEFEQVYLFDLNQDDIPGQSRQAPLSVPDELIKGEVLPAGDWHRQEERRLMYVAMTRAKRSLTLSFSPDHGGKRMKKPSVFINEATGISPVVEAGLVPKADNLKRFAALPQMEPIIQAKLLDMQGRLLLTPHQIDDYLSCPYNFRYKYLLQVPEPPSPVLMFGTVIHRIINQYFILKEKADPVDAEALVKMIQPLWQSDGFDSKHHEQQRLAQAEDTIRRFYQREESSGVKPLFSEKAFEFELPEAKAIVRGRFDVVMPADNGQVEIRDYKTSQVETEEKADDKAKSSVQLAIYALAWQEMTGQPPQRVVLDYVNTGQLGTTVKTPKQLASMRDKILAVAEGIRAGEFPLGDCRYCQHRPLAADRERVHAR